MAKPIHRQVLIAALLLTLAAAWLALNGSPPVTTQALHLTLPERVGPYVGKQIRFCQNEACLHTFLLDDLADPDVCTVCGGPLAGTALAEKRILPADTTIIRRQYVDPRGDVMMTSIVLSGLEQKSIHRPQQCLPAQGYTIERQRAISVPLAGRDPLDLTLLDLVRTARTPQGQPIRVPHAYAYWFTDGERETPYHLQRLAWMTADRIVRRTARQWAYISIVTSRREDSDGHIDRLDRFLSALYPLLRSQP